MKRSSSSKDNPIRVVSGVKVKEFGHDLGPCQNGFCDQCPGVAKNGERAEVRYLTCSHTCHGATEPERFEGMVVERVEARERAAAEAAQSPQTKKASPRKKSGICQCGCEGTTKGGRFLPGHDAKLKSALRRRAQEGDQEAVNELQERGWT